MTLEEKLRFLADRVVDEKEFSINGEDYIYRFRNCELMYVENEKNDDYQLSIRSLSLNYILSSLLKLKPQWEFTEDEKTILRNLPEQYNWIARDDDETMGELFVYGFKPSKFDDTWIFYKGSVIDFNSFKHLFQSIQWSNDEPCEFRKYL